MISEVGGIDRPLPNRDLDDGIPGDRRKDGDRDHDVDQQPETTGRRSAKGGSGRPPRRATGSGAARSERDADDAERDLEEGEGEVEIRNGACPDQRGEGRYDDERDLGHAETDRPRCHQRQCAASLGIAALDTRDVAKPERSKRRQLDEEMPQRPRDDAEGEPIDTERRASTGHAPMIDEVVDDRGDRGRREPATAS